MFNIQNEHDTRRQSGQWTGRINIVFGFAYLVFTLAMGMYVNNRILADAPWLSSEFSRSMLGTALVQSNVDGALNILAGYLILRLPLVHWLSRLASILMISGAFLHSGMLYLAGFGIGLASSVIPFGVVIIASVMLFMSIGAISAWKISH